MAAIAAILLAAFAILALVNLDLWLGRQAIRKEQYLRRSLAAPRFTITGQAIAEAGASRTPNANPVTALPVSSTTLNVTR